MKQIARNFLQGRSGKTVCNNGSVGLARYLAHKLHDFTKDSISRPKYGHQIVRALARHLLKP